VIPLPPGVAADPVEASLRDGVLEIRIPEPAGQGTRRRRSDPE
jgi:HSP20 family molecular chaperone IbpA